MKGFLRNLAAVAVLCLFSYSVCWGVGYALADLKHAKAEVKKAEDRRDAAQLRLANVLAETREREEWSERFFIIAVNVGEDLDDLQACMELAWIVCEEEGEVVCSMDVRGGCWFSCCPEEED